MTTALPAALLLAAGGLVAGLAAVVGAVAADVPAAAGAATPAAFVVLLSGLVAVALTAVRPLVGAAFSAGAGVIGVARLLADLFVVLQPASVARPELFYPRDGRAYPVAFSAGSLLLIAGDGLMIVAGGLAARAVASAVRDRVEDLGSARTGPLPFPDVDDDQDDDSVPTKNVPMLAVGFVAVAVLGFGAAQLPYQGGYVEARQSLPGTDLGSVLTPFLLVLICLGAVLLAGTLPRAPATGLLAGTAVALAVPTLTAYAAALDGAPVDIAGPAVLVPLGALVLVVVGRLTRVRWIDDPDSTDTSVPPDMTDTDTGIADAFDGGMAHAVRPSGTWGTVSALLTLTSGALALTASVSPILRLNGVALGNGRTELPVPIDGVPALTRGAFGWPFLVAGVLLLVAGLIGALGRADRFVRLDLSAVARAGKAATGVFWVLPVIAPAAPILALQSLGRAADQTQVYVDRGVIDPASVDRWTSGPGLWVGVLAGLLAMIAAVVAAVALRREQQEDVTADDDGAADAARGPRGVIGVVVLAAGIATLAVPTFHLGAAAGPAFFSLSGHSWTIWLMFGAVVIAALTGTFARYASVACSMLAAAALLLATRLWPAADVSAAAGFRTAAGAVIAVVVVVVLLGCAAATALVVRRVRDAPAALQTADG